MITRVKLWLAALLRRRRYERELDAELDFHRAMRVDALVADGVAPAEAERLARAELGMTELYRDDCRRARGLALVDALARDVRLAVRALARSPGYALTATLVLALPLAATLVAFAMFNVYALSPPIPHPERWVEIGGVTRNGMNADWFTAEEADALLATPPGPFEALYTQRAVDLPLEVGTRPRGGAGSAVSANYFAALGLHAQRGRVFSGVATQDRGGIVLSEHGRGVLFDGADDVVGRRILVAGRQFEVIGVAGDAFFGVQPWKVAYWMLEDDHRALVPEDAARDVAIEVGGFLRPGATVEQAAQALAPRLRAEESRRPESLRLATVLVEARRGRIKADNEAKLGAIPVAAVLLLLLAVSAANLANVVLARNAARRHDLAVRAALGASRLRLFGALFAECVLIALVAGHVAFAVVAAALGPLHDTILGFNATMGMQLLDVGVDATVWLAAVGLALGMAIVFGVVPALIVTSPFARGGRDLDAQALRRAGTGRLRTVLMTGQLAASMLLVVVAGLVAANARLIDETDPKFPVARMVSIEAGAEAGKVAQALARVPAVEAVGGAVRPPLLGEALDLLVRVGDVDYHDLRVRHVDAGYLDVLDVAIEQGRTLRDADAGTRVVVVSRATAELLWPGRNPVGRALEIDNGFEEEPLMERFEVVGVAEDLASGLLLGGQDRSMIYVPVARGHALADALVVRLSDTEAPTLDAVWRACHDAAPTLDCRPFEMTRALALNRMPFNVASRVAAVLGWSALAISCIGLYGLVGFLVAQQRREIGIRLALGATAGAATRWAMRPAARQIAVGAAIGVVVALGFAQALASVTDRVRTLDAGAFFGDPLLLVAVALLAAWLPARRCARIEPNEALRPEA